MIPEQISDKIILIAPLDWGLGHTTRCISLIKKLLKANNQIVFAGNQDQIEIIKNDFPNLNFEFLEGYNVKLDATKSTYLQLLKQLKPMNKSIKAEREIANELAKKHNADIILSDNRYGFRADSTLNVFLTHQLSPPVPYFKKTVKKKIAAWVNQFDFCWIIDDIKQPLCVELNQNHLLIPIHYIGWLSRFEVKKVNEKYDFLVIASGAQPERNRFKNEITSILKKGEFAFAVVDNINGNSLLNNSFVNPSTDQLGDLINSSKTVITRCGYTSIMELMYLNKNAILIPTKGQYEQEYLANHLTTECFEILTLTEFKRKFAQISR